MACPSSVGSVYAARMPELGMKIVAYESQKPPYDENAARKKKKKSSVLFRHANAEDRNAAHRENAGKMREKNGGVSD